MMMKNIVTLLLLEFGYVSSFSMSMSSASNPGSDLSGKVVAQRFLYRLSPTKSSVTTPYTIEERQYFSVGEDRSLEPFGDKCFILRGPENTSTQVDAEAPPETLKKNGQPRMYTRIGPSLYKIDNVAEEEEEESLGSSLWESSHAMILYCMANPEYIKGKGLEVGAGIGIGGILSCIGAGVALDSTKSSEDIENSPPATSDAPSEEGEDEEGLPGFDKKFAPVPENLAKLILTDSHEHVLNECFTNVNKSSFPPSKVEIMQLDWNQRVPNEMKSQYDFIIGCDCAYYFPLVNPLARTVAYTLQTSPYDRVDNEQTVGGRFVHIGPAHRESIQDLRKKLSKGYKMNTSTQSLVLERFDLVPLFLDSLKEVNDQLEEEIEGETAGFVEYQNIATTSFTSLVGHHHEDYDGFNGEYFFPADTGREDNYGGDGTELDSGF